MRFSILAIAVLATVAWEATVVQGVPLQQSGPVKLDWLHSATTCSPRSPLTSDHGLPSSLLTSRSVTPVRWTTPDAPGIALQVFVMNTVPSGARLANWMSGLVINMAGAPQDMQEEHLPQGLLIHEDGPVAGARFLFSICPYPTSNPLLTWDMAHQVLFSLCRYMAMRGGPRLVQYHAFRAGATPDQDVQFASGTITTMMVGAMPVAPQARSLPAEPVGGRPRVIS